MVQIPPQVTLPWHFRSCFKEHTAFPSKGQFGLRYTHCLVPLFASQCLRRFLTIRFEQREWRLVRFECSNHFIILILEIVTFAFGFFNQYVIPIAFNNIGFKYLIANAVWNVAFVVLLYFLLVETKQIPMEELDAKFDGEVHSSVEKIGAGGIVLRKGVELQDIYSEEVID